MPLETVEKHVGEVNPDELFDTTLDPKTRNLIQITLEDKESSSELNKLFFGNSSDKRKDFIQSNIL